MKINEDARHKCPINRAQASYLRQTEILLNFVYIEAMLNVCKMIVILDRQKRENYVL
jgi:hypothetical protein